MNNLRLPLVAPNQAQKELTINDQALAVDAAFSEILTIDLSEGAALLTDGQFTRNFTFDCVGAQQAEALTVPKIKRLFSVQNSGGFDITVDVFDEGGSTVIVAAGEMAILHCDGANVRTAVAGGSAVGIGDVPNDGVAYSRKDGQWVDSGLGDVAAALDAINGEVVP